VSSAALRYALMIMLAIMISAPANADELRPGYIELTQVKGQDWRLIWKAPLRSGLTSQTQPILPKGCTITGETERRLATQAVITQADVRCIDDLGGKTIGLSAFGGSKTDILVRIAPLNRPVQALRLTATEPSATISARPDRWQVARTYFITGIDHILFGYDHLLFVVAMVLLLSHFWPIAKAVTAFTIAHSITLIGTTLGLLGLPQQPVEAVIALSILFLAVEIAKADSATPRLSQRLPWVVAFAFGLLHGFGFAGALQEIGLPENDVPTALLTFNIGVEAGQLVIVAATLLVLAGIRRLPNTLPRYAIQTATYAIGIIASFWFIERIVA
jgi:hydrogenase/urease accessory protein HupE